MDGINASQPEFTYNDPGEPDYAYFIGFPLDIGILYVTPDKKVVIATMTFSVLYINSNDIKEQKEISTATCNYIITQQIARVLKVKSEIIFNCFKDFRHKYNAYLARQPIKFSIPDKTYREWMEDENQFSDS